MSRYASLVWIVAAACGDAGTVLVEIDAVSGTRIKLEKFLYADGTREVDASGFYDTRLHTRCTPRRWADDSVRCVPVAGDALYTDASCSAAIGVAAHLSFEPTNPVDANWVTHFIGYDVVDGASLPARLYSAGAETAPVTDYFARRDGQCIGPFAAPVDTTYYTVADEIAQTVMPVISESELGGGRLALRVLETTDGLRVPIGLRDRELEATCTATVRGDGVTCEPDGAEDPTWFSDSSCTTPVIVVADDAQAPSLVRITDDAGCAIYKHVGSEISAALYRRRDDACVRTAMADDEHAFALGDPLALPQLVRTLEDDASRRLAHVTLQDAGDDDLRFASDRLFDRAIRDECRREVTGDTAHCVPAATRPTRTLYANDCVVPVTVVELPARSCRPITFATSVLEDGSGTSLHAIGDRVTETLMWDRGLGCVPYTPVPGTVLHHVGPPLPPETFMSALKYGER